MPIYRYECPDCGKEVERIQDYDDHPPSCLDVEDCENPDTENVEFNRRIGRPNAHFRGSGFHSTDYDDANNAAS